MPVEEGCLTFGEAPGGLTARPGWTWAENSRATDRDGDVSEDEAEPAGGAASGRR